MSMINGRHSPLFSKLVLCLKKKNVQELGKIFPLKSIDTWVRVRHEKFYSTINLFKVKKEIYSNLVDPLFLKPSINIRDEDSPHRHRKDNLFCCIEGLIRELRKANKKGAHDEFEIILQQFEANFKKIAPGALCPFVWILKPSTDETPPKLRQRLDELIERQDGIDKARDSLIEGSLDEYLGKNWTRLQKEKETVEFELYRKKRDVPDQRITLMLDMAEGFLRWLKWGRGKPGRHPKPFNVFVYHLINRCTTWKLDKNRRDVMRHDGQHRLERDWDLILFLLLDVHTHRARLPELDRFISQNGKKMAHEALRILKKRLWDIYKNFPPKDGWSHERKILETGFRKLIVSDGKLKIVRL